MQTKHNQTINTMFRFSTITILLLLVLTSCFSPWEGDGNAAFSLYLGNQNPASRAVDPNTGIETNDLIHVIELEGPSGSQTINVEKGSSKVDVSVAPGLWTITVQAYLESSVPGAAENELCYEGSATVELIAGDNSVSIKMNAVEIDPEHEHTPSEDWESGETQHWKVCTDEECPDEGIQLEPAEHTSSDQITEEATTEAEGRIYTECTICKFVLSEEIIPQLDPEHEHTASEDWGGDEDQHWKLCIDDDGAKLEPADHTPSESITEEATTEAEGRIYTECTICERVLSEEIIPIIDPSGRFNITFEQMEEGAPIVLGKTLKINGTDEERSATLSAPGTYDSIEWYIGPERIADADNNSDFPISLDPADAELGEYYYLGVELPGKYIVHLRVVKDGIPYSTNIIVTVEGEEDDEDEPPIEDPVPDPSLKAATIRYTFEDNSSYYFCFDNYGQSQRIEMNIEGMKMIYMYDEINEVYSMYNSITQTWSDAEAEEIAIMFPFMASTFQEQLQYWDSLGGTITTETIAGQNCDVYRLEIEGEDSIEYGVWENTVLLSMISSGEDSITADIARTGCPEGAFDQRTDIVWGLE
jgi:hypothetical protein